MLISQKYEKSHIEFSENDDKTKYSSFYTRQSDEFTEWLTYRQKRIKRNFKIIINIFFLSFLSAPIMASYVTMGDFAVFMFNNRYFFLFFTLTFCIISFVFQKISSNKIIRISATVLILITVWYYTTVFLRFYKVEASIVYYIGEKLPYKNLIL